MTYSVDGFQWYYGNTDKIKAHGLTVEDIEYIFLNEPWVGEDFKHSEKECRYIAYGKTKGGRPAFIAFTYRVIKEQTLIRPISARFMHKKEVETYEKIKNR